MSKTKHYPAQVGHITSNEYKGQYVICACQLDEWGEGPMIPVKEYPTHLLRSIDVNELAQEIEEHYWLNTSSSIACVVYDYLLEWGESDDE